MNLGTRHALLSLVLLLAVRAAAAQTPPRPAISPAVVTSDETPALLLPTGEVPPPNPQSEGPEKGE